VCSLRNHVYIRAAGWNRRDRVAFCWGLYVFVCYGVTVGSKASSLSIL